jgi:hypothetical protein
VGDKKICRRLCRCSRKILIEDLHVEQIIGRKAGNTLGAGGDPAKGAAAAEGVRPMYARDYVELCAW